MLLTCRSLQSIVDDALAQTYEDMQKQKEKVDYALADRIMETKDSKCKMEEQLAYVRLSRLKCFSLFKIVHEGFNQLC